MTEQWRDIPGYEGLYQVSDQGSICRLRDDRRIMKPISDNKGYQVVTLSLSGQKKLCKVHRLVLAAFNGLSEMQVNHKDGNKANNNLSNLEYCTAAENVLHAHRVLGINTPRGEARVQSKLKEPQVLSIVAMRKTGLTCRQIAERVGISDGTVSDICRKVTWTHLPEVMSLPDPLPNGAGKNNSQAKLTEDDARAILEMLRDGVAGITIAYQFNVTQSAVSRIKSGKRWPHLQGGK